MTEGWMIESLHGVWVHESGEAFAVGSNGAIYHYTGSVWEDQSIEFETVTFHDVWGFSPDDVYAVGEHAAIYHYDGVSWWAVPTPPDVDATLYAVHGTDMGGGDVVLLSAGENGTVIGFSPGILRRPTFTGSGVQSSGIISLFDRDLR